MAKRFPQRNPRAVARHRGLGELPENMMLQRGDRLKQKEQFDPYQQGGDVRNVQFNNPNAPSFGGRKPNQICHIELVSYPAILTTNATTDMAIRLMPQNPKREYLMISSTHVRAGGGFYVLFEDLVGNSLTAIDVTVKQRGIYLDSDGVSLNMIEFDRKVPINAITIIIPTDGVGGAATWVIGYEG